MKKILGSCLLAFMLFADVDGAQREAMRLAEEAAYQAEVERFKSDTLKCIGLVSKTDEPANPEGGEEARDAMLTSMTTFLQTHTFSSKEATKEYVLSNGTNPYFVDALMTIIQTPPAGVDTLLLGEFSRTLSDHEPMQPLLDDLARAMITSVYFCNQARYIRVPGSGHFDTRIFDPRWNFINHFILVHKEARPLARAICALILAHGGKTEMGEILSQIVKRVPATPLSQGIFDMVGCLMLVDNGITQNICRNLKFLETFFESIRILPHFALQVVETIKSLLTTNAERVEVLTLEHDLSSDPDRLTKPLPHLLNSRYKQLLTIDSELTVAEAVSTIIKDHKQNQEALGVTLPADKENAKNSLLFAAARLPKLIFGFNPMEDPQARRALLRSAMLPLEPFWQSIIQGQAFPNFLEVSLVRCDWYHHDPRGWPTLTLHMLNSLLRTPSVSTGGLLRLLSDFDGMIGGIANLRYANPNRTAIMDEVERLNLEESIACYAEHPYEKVRKKVRNLLRDLGRLGEDSDERH